MATADFDADRDSITEVRHREQRTRRGALIRRLTQIVDGLEKRYPSPLPPPPSPEDEDDAETIDVAPDEDDAAAGH